MPLIAAPAARAAWSAPARWRTAVLPVAATVAAVTLAVIAWLYGSQEIRGDARGYYDLAVQIALGGPGSFASTFRTYGYPAFLAPLIPIVGTDPERVRTAAFVVQLALFLAVAWLGAHRLSRALGLADRWPWIYAVTACNPFMLMHSIQMLTDVLSATLVYLAAVLSIPTETEAEARSAAERGDGRSWRPTLLGMLVMAVGGLAVMVRPPNLLLIPVLLLAWLMRTVRYRQVPWRAWPALLAMLVLPFAPQTVSNYRAYGVPHPFIVLDQFESNSSRAMRLAKYATVSIPGIPARLFYYNPFGPAQNTPPFELLRDEPLRFGAIVAVRTFAYFDQDFPFTYISDLTPWYRWPLAIPNYLYLLAGFAGLCLGLRRPSGGTGAERSRFRRTLTMLGVAIVTIWAMYMPTNVENRYSLPIYPLLAAPCLIAVMRLRAATRGRPALLTLLAIGAAVWVGALAAMSFWLDRYAPDLLAARAAVAAPPPSPSAAYRLDLPDDWEPGQMVTIPIQVTNTGRDAWQSESFFPVVVRAQFVALKTEQHRLLPTGSRVYVSPDGPVAPGQSTTVLATLQTPTATGRYVMKVTVIRHGIDEAGPDFEQQVKVDKGR
jgi:hypothetical protein